MTFELERELSMDDTMVIDTDSHVTEPPDVWVDRMSSKKWGDLVPQVKWEPDSTNQAWFVGDTRVAAVGSSAMLVGEQGAVAEIERCAELAHRGLIMTGTPHLHDEPFLPDRHWDPIWSAAQAHCLPVNFHAAGGDISQHYNPARNAASGVRASQARA